MELRDFFIQHPRTALAFSGGTDSAYLLYAARAAGAQARPYFLNTPFQPAFELADARRLCGELGAELTVLEADVLACPEVAANPPDRCRHCKRILFTRLLERAAEDGLPTVIDGTNASDDAGDRPGMKVLRELGILSPLRLCGITKGEVRRRSRAAGLFTADKPSYACLATRIPAGIPLTAAALAGIEAAEGRVAALGFTDFRVRAFHGCARLQVCAEQMPRAVALGAELREALAPDFGAVLLDLSPRPGIAGEEREDQINRQSSME